MIEKAHELALDDQRCNSDGAAAQARLLAELEQEHGARVTANRRHSGQRRRVFDDGVDECAWRGCEW